MHNSESPIESEHSPESNLDEMRLLIRSVRESILNEKTRSENTWFSCVNTQLQGLMVLTQFAKEDHEISEERANELLARINSLAREVKEKMEQYPNADDVIPEEIQEEMYRKLNILED